MKETSEMPKHVAVIMDGNGRWAKRRELPRIHGHRAGVERVEEIIQAASDCGVEYLTLYAFSKENWQRPPQEVSFLMQLLNDYLDKLEREAQNKKKGVFNAIGQIEDLPLEIQNKIHRIAQLTKNYPGIHVTFAFSYSSRLEMTHACRSIAEKVLQGALRPEQINESTVNDHLYGESLPDPDLLIRTSGEMRVSNFLLWQISYTELYVTEKCWPEFDRKEFAQAMEAYKRRERRFGRTRAVA